jgi:hypothetical protein
MVVWAPLSNQITDERRLRRRTIGTMLDDKASDDG